MIWQAGRAKCLVRLNYNRKHILKFNRSISKNAKIYYNLSCKMWFILIQLFLMLFVKWNRDFTPGFKVWFWTPTYPWLFVSCLYKGMYCTFGRWIWLTFLFTYLPLRIESKLSIWLFIGWVFVSCSLLTPIWGCSEAPTGLYLLRIWIKLL